MQTEKNNLLECWIFDIDSTLALRDGRKPFNWSDVDKDIPNVPVVEIYKALREYKPDAHFILVTGRDEVCRAATEKWLKDNGITHNGLYMRPLNSRDLDVTIKTSIYRTHIEGKYKVLAVFEDRNRCVDLYRNHFGLTVLDVAGGRY